MESPRDGEHGYQVDTDKYDSFNLIIILFFTADRFIIQL